jgi:L-lactate dehydrogenase complex protein LldG
VTAREELLGRIRGALADVPATERPTDVEVPRRYRLLEDGDLVARFAERLREYRTTVVPVPCDGVAAAVADRCRVHGASRIAVPADLPHAWRPAGVELLDERALDVAALDAVDGALTACTLAIAETGTIVLTGAAGEGSRRLTLVPDLHLCVVREEQVVGGVPEALARVAPHLRAGRGWVTLVSGPSATSDIEFARVEGVHGPRRLDVLVVSASAAPGEVVPPLS